MKEQDKDIQITLTKKFHTTYWKHKTMYLNYSILSLAAALIIMIVGAVYDALPIIHINAVLVTVFMYFALIMGTFSAGLHFGMGVVGNQISEKLHEEHPELFPEAEKKDV
jgi:hypothetical protein